MPAVTYNTLAQNASTGALNTSTAIVLPAGSYVASLPRSLQFFGDFRGVYASVHDWDLLNMAAGGVAFPGGIVITSWYVDCSVASPTTQLNANLMYCDALGGGAFPGANQVTVDSLVSTSGNSSRTDMSGSTLGSGIIPTNKILYIHFNADPTDLQTTWSLVINYRMG